MIYPEIIGARIASWRKMRGYSQATLASALSVSPQAVSNWERGQSIPDLETLLELSHLFDVSLHAILEARHTDLQSAAPVKRLNDLPAGQARLLAPVCSCFSIDELNALCDLLQEEESPLSLQLNARSGDKSVSTSFSPDQLSDAALHALAPQLTTLFSSLLNRPDQALRQLLPQMICPRCGQPLRESYHVSNPSLCCPDGHTFPIIDGVPDFGTREIRGEFWSLYLRGYQHYCAEREKAFLSNPNYLRGRDHHEMYRDEILRLKPRLILDIASGMGSCLELYIRDITWPCTIVLTDISHRILKYDRQWFREQNLHPGVQVAFVACDCAHLPFQDGTFDVITSFAGFQSMQAKCREGFAEAFRVLKPGGSAVYDMGLIEGNENSRAWLDILTRCDDQDVRAFAADINITPDDWAEFCAQVGYTSTSCQQIYGELPAPQDGLFPFENEILQWAAAYLFTCFKPL